MSHVELVFPVQLRYLERYREHVLVAVVQRDRELRTMRCDRLFRTVYRLLLAALYVVFMNVAASPWSM